MGTSSERDETMSMLERSDAYWKFAGQCTQCGHCTKACNSLIEADMTLGDIAKALLAHEREAVDIDDLRYRIATDGQLTQAVRACFFCRKFCRVLRRAAPRGSHRGRPAPTRVEKVKSSISLPILR